MALVVIALATGCVALAVALVVHARVGGPATSSARRGELAGRARGEPSAPAPLVYAVGRRIHVGRRVVLSQDRPLSLVPTVGGAAFTTFDGAVRFTDGQVVTQVGMTEPAHVTSTGVMWGASGRPFARLVADPSGRGVAWLEYAATGPARPTLVVFDAARRRQSLRLPVRPDAACPTCARVLALRDDVVYWTTAPTGDLTSGAPDDALRVFRCRISTGRQSAITLAAYRAQTRGGPRTLVVGPSYARGRGEHGVGQDLAFVDGRLVVDALGPADALFDPRRGRRLLLAPPASYAGRRLGPADAFYLTQWLDDDRFVLLDATGSTARPGTAGTFLVCRLPTQRCAVALRPRTPWPLVPGVETRGSQLAEEQVVGGTPGQPSEGVASRRTASAPAA